MKRNCSLEEISDGKLYSANDMVKIGCDGCSGEATCCHGMGNSIILDPFDVYRLTSNLNTKFQKLLEDKIELNVVDGIILPNLKMTGKKESCGFLDEEGRCKIHTHRPGICRIFPLGRYYENHDFKYFLQVNECKNNRKAKIKVSKWIDTSEGKKYEQFIKDWHYFLNDIEDLIKSTQDEKSVKTMNMYLLNSFYITEYNSNVDFYEQFYDRLNRIRKVF